MHNGIDHHVKDLELMLSSYWSVDAKTQRFPFFFLRNGCVKDLRLVYNKILWLWFRRGLSN
jgi:hypothetical protein